MNRKRYTPEQIIGMLREAEVGLVQGEKVGPICRRRCVDHLQEELMASERRACSTIGQHRSTQCKRLHGRPDEDALTADIIRPHSSLSYRPPAPETILPRPTVPAYATLQPEQQGINPRQTLS